MAVTLMPMPWWQPLDDLGNPVPGGLLYFFAAGTLIDSATYADATGLIVHPQPVVLDGFGRATVYLGPSSYKVIFTTPIGALIREQDLMAAVPVTNVDLDVAGVAGETLSSRESVYLSDGTGGTIAGRWYRTDSDVLATSVLPPLIGFVVNDTPISEAISVRLKGRMDGFSSLTPGANYYLNTALGTITTSIQPHNLRFVGKADTATSLLIQPTDANAVTGASRFVYNAGTTPGTGVAAGVTAFLGARGRSATETSSQDLSPVTGTLKNLYVLTDGAVGAGETFVFTVRKNAADTVPAITCTVTNAGLTAFDITNSVAVAAGDRICVKVVASAGASTREMACSFEIAY